MAGIEGLAEAPADILQSLNDDVCEARIGKITAGLGRGG